MKKKLKGMQTETTAILCGAAIFLIMLMIGILITTFAVYKEWIHQETAPYGITVSVLMSAMCGTWIAIQKNRDMRLLICIVSLLIYFMILVIMNIIVFHQGMSGVPATLGIIAAGAASVFALSITPKKSRFGRKIKM